MIRFVNWKLCFRLCCQLWIVRIIALKVIVLLMGCRVNLVILTCNLDSVVIAPLIAQ